MYHYIQVENIDFSINFASQIVRDTTACTEDRTFPSLATSLREHPKNICSPGGPLQISRKKKHAKYQICHTPPFIEGNSGRELQRG